MGRATSDRLHRFSHSLPYRTCTLSVFEQPAILDLDLQIEGIQSVAAVNNYSKIGRSFRESDKCGFDLAGENDEAANDDRIIGAPLDRADLGVCQTTSAALIPPGT